ncbi:DUF2785 domain-containing protein [Sporosarcina luteola]|uniref:DUF2785 domain-containing protein n=1 Tax=Sporosarcina luteola TaxID=582850 RepID=UPI00203ACC49|nr:DUF2785 domain-containing protein [Sporosarcina luteola]MCM3711117.1 DUF2785 domain-containing protein [Sporosarcina luteola]
MNKISIKASDNMSLKSELKNLDETLQHANLDHLIERMLENIGSTDPELRDSLIYNSFGKLIMENYLTIKQMNYILVVSLRNLFQGIGQKEDDSVFSRSFSSLVLVLLLMKDKEERFLSDDTLKQLTEGSIAYLKLEEDIRGHVAGKGWAHSIAHGADLLTEAINHPNFTMTFSSECLETIKLSLFKDSTRELPYVDDEEERLVYAVVALQEKGVSDSEIEDWLSTISDDLTKLVEKEGYSLNFFWKRSNVIKFLRGYYFRLLYKNESLQIRESIVEILERWHKETFN